MMRALAVAERVSPKALRDRAEKEIIRQFVSSGITRRLAADEVERARRRRRRA